MSKKDICGLQVAMEELPKAGGFDLRIDNPLPKVNAVDFDFSGSSNLQLVQGEDNCVNITGPLTCTVNAPASRSGLVVGLRSLDTAADVKLNLAATPAASSTPSTLECGMQVFTQQLGNLDGFVLRLSNPTSKTFETEFDFGKSSNLRAEALGKSKVDGMKVSAVIAPNASDVEFAKLATISKDVGIRMEYSLTTQEL